MEPQKPNPFVLFLCYSVPVSTVGVRFHLLKDRLMGTHIHSQGIFKTCVTSESCF